MRGALLRTWKRRFFAYARSGALLRTWKRHFFAYAQSGSLPAAILLWGAASAFAGYGGSGGPPGYEFVLRQQDIRAMGMGGAFSALSDDDGALFANPAGAAYADHSYISFGANSGPSAPGYTTSPGVLLQGSYLWKNDNQKNAFGLSWGQYGLNYNGYDINGNPLSGSIGEEDYDFALTYSQQFWNYFSFGFQAQHASENLSAGSSGLNNFSASALMGTAGFQYRPSERMSFGFDEYNYGMTNSQAGFSTPGGTRFGAAYRLLDHRNLILALDYDRPSYAAGQSVDAGLEWGINGTLFLRGGVSDGNQQITPSFGIGLALDRLILDFAFNNGMGALGFGPQLSMNLSWRFYARGGRPSEETFVHPPETSPTIKSSPQRHSAPNPNADQEGLIFVH